MNHSLTPILAQPLQAVKKLMRNSCARSSLSVREATKIPRQDRTSLSHHFLPRSPSPTGQTPDFRHRRRIRFPALLHEVHVRPVGRNRSRPNVRDCLTASSRDAYRSLPGLRVEEHGPEQRHRQRIVTGEPGAQDAERREPHLAARHAGAGPPPWNVPGDRQRRRVPPGVANVCATRRAEDTADDGLHPSMRNTRTDEIP